MCFINKLDRTGADFYKDVASIHERLTPNAYPIQLPIGAEEKFIGIIDLLTQRAHIYLDDLGVKHEERDVPDDLKEKVAEWRHRLIEAIVENDEKLMEQYLGGVEPSIPDLKRVLRAATIANTIVPILCGSALKNKGVQFMLDAVIDYLPSPLEVPPLEAIDVDHPGNKITIAANDSDPFTALAFKVATDPFVGKLAFFRVYSGSLKSGSYILNVNTGNKERLGRIVRLHANSREDVEMVYAGEIAAAVGLSNTFTGHTICDPNRPVLLETISFPEPVFQILFEVPL